MNPIKMVLFLSFLYSIVSCEQNPLKAVPKELQEGVLETGAVHLDLFDPFLYSRLIRVNIKGGQSGRDCQTGQDGKTVENCLRMEFYEGEENSYSIHIRTLHGVEKRYDLELDTSTFSHLEEQGLRVTQKRDKNKKHRTMIINWKPNQIFAKNQSARVVRVDLIINGSDKLKTKPPFTISRQIDIVVHKVLDSPEIYKVSTRYDDYEKLDDGQFYTKYKAESLLNLGHYDRLFFGKKEDRTDENKNGKEIFSHLKFYSHLHKRRHPSIRFFDVYNQYDQSVPYELLSYLKQNIYLEKDLKEEGAHCFHRHSQQGRCIIPAQTKNYSAIDFNKSPVYVKRYKVPESIDFESLFYKVEDFILCEIYKDVRSFKKSNTNSQDGEAPCYLPVSQVYFLNGLEEKENVYLLKEDKNSGEKDFELIDRSQWSFFFHEIPESVQWQLSGYPPVPKGIPVPINLVRGDENKIDFFVKDYNFTSPQLLPLPDDGESVFWMRDMKYLSTEPIEGERNSWKITYSLTADENFSHSFDQFSGSLRPYSYTKHGSKASFSFHLLPEVKVKYIENFQPEKGDAQFSYGIKQSGKVKEYDPGSLILSNQIKIQYIFPSDFLSQLDQKWPFTERFKKYLRFQMALFEEYLKSRPVKFNHSLESLNALFDQYGESNTKTQSEILFTKIFKKYLKSQTESNPSEYLLENILENILAYIKIEEIKSYSQYNYSAKGRGADPLYVDPFIIRNKDLECSGFKEIEVEEEQNEGEGLEKKENRDSIYIENVCDYKTRIQLNPKQLEPAYLYYEYCLGDRRCGDIKEKAFLTSTLSDLRYYDVSMTLVKDDFQPMYPIFMELEHFSRNSHGTASPEKGDSQQAAVGPASRTRLEPMPADLGYYPTSVRRPTPAGSRYYSKTDRPIPANSNYYPMVMASKKDFIGNRIHIFLNLSPEWSYKEKTNSDGETNREHTIIYKMNNAGKLKSQWKSYLPPGVSVHLRCENKNTLSQEDILLDQSQNKEALSQDSHSSCPCEEPVISEEGVEIKCLFGKAKVDLFTHWETNNPYVYFLNADPKHHDSPRPHKKTPVTKIEIK